MSQMPFHQQYPERPCAVCGEQARDLLFRQTFSSLSHGTILQGYDVVTCSECGFVFSDHIPNQTHLDALYRDMSKYEYQDQGGRETVYDHARLEAMVRTLIPFLSGSDVHLLDVGCATGGLLSLFKKNAYHNVLGLDPSSLSAEIAWRLHGVRVVTGALSEISELLADEQPFDCVILAGVLEHIHDLDHALSSIRELLSDRGILCIEAPDASAFICCPDAPYQQFSTEHINFFTPVSLGNLMDRYGFSPVSSEQNMRDQSSTTIMPVITAVYRKEQNPLNRACIHDSKAAKTVRAYIDKSREMEDHIQRTIDKLVEDRGPLAIWGVGTHTLHLLASSRLSLANISLFVDSNPRYQGSLLHGVPIQAPAVLKGRTEAILISSRVFQLAIEHQIRDELGLNNEIIKLYEI